MLEERAGALAGVPPAPEPLAQPRSERPPAAPPVHVDSGEADYLTDAVLAVSGSDEIRGADSVVALGGDHLQELQRVLRRLVGVSREILRDLVDGGFVPRTDPVQFRPCEPFPADVGERLVRNR
jgi:hypothetical protein